MAKLPDNVLKYISSDMEMVSQIFQSISHLNNPEETKPEETKLEETKPEETKPEETKPEETKPEVLTKDNFMQQLALMLSTNSTKNNNFPEDINAIADLFGMTLEKEEVESVGVMNG